MKLAAHKLFRQSPALLLAALCFFVASHAVFPSSALAQKPALTLKDTERGTAVDLYPTGDPKGEGFYLYTNEKYGYSAWIPVEITEVVTLPDNEDGLILASKDGKARYRASGGLVEFSPGGLKGAFDEAYSRHQEKSTDVLFVQNKLRAFWVISWKEEGVMHHRKFAVKGDNWFDCEFFYPASLQEKYGFVTDDVLRNSGFPEE